MLETATYGDFANAALGTALSPLLSFPSASFSSPFIDSLQLQLTAPLHSYSRSHPSLHDIQQQQHVPQISSLPFTPTSPSLSASWSSSPSASAIFPTPFISPLGSPVLEPPVHEAISLWPHADEAEAVSPIPTANAAAHDAERANERLEDNTVTGAASEQKLDRKPTHRHLDVRRRLREAQCIARLAELAASVDLSAAASSTTRRPRASRKKRQRRLTTLEDVANKLEALITRVALLEQSTTDPHSTRPAVDQRQPAPSAVPSLTTSSHSSSTVLHSSSQLTSSLTIRASSDPPPTADSHRSSILNENQLSGRSRDQSLYTYCFISSPYCLSLGCASNGRLLDANPQYLDHRGWEPVSSASPLILPPYDIVLGWRSGQQETVAQYLSRAVTASRAGPGSRPQRARPANEVARPGPRFVDQYSRSADLLQDLYAGRTDRIVAVWRRHMADGLLYEVEETTFVVKREDLLPGQGLLECKPVQVASFFLIGVAVPAVMACV